MHGDSGSISDGARMTPQVCIHGGLRRQCQTCDLADEVAVLTARLAQREAAITDLVAETCECCGTCAHSDESQAPRAGETHCTRPSGDFNGRVMPLSARCADHTARGDA